jgi:hypothetical protein
MPAFYVTASDLRFFGNWILVIGLLAFTCRCILKPPEDWHALDWLDQMAEVEQFIGILIILYACAMLSDAIRAVIL